MAKKMLQMQAGDGVTCDGWSRQGSRHKYAHGSEAAHNCFIARRRALALACLEDFAFIECVVGYDWQTKVVDALQSTHNCMVIESNPLVQGHAVRRSRIFACVANLQTQVYVGNLDWEADYAAKTHRALSHHADIYLGDSDQARLEEYQSYVESQCNYPTTECLRQLEGHDLFAALATPDTLERFDTYMDMVPEKGSMSGVCLFDLHQNPGCRSSCGPLWPSMLTHGMITAVKSDGSVVGATSMEHLGALGWHVHESVETECSPSTMTPLFQSLSPGKRKTLAGRGVHLPSSASWMYFCLSNFKPRPKVTIPQRIVTDADSDNDDDDV